MRDYRDAKVMAKALREQLDRRALALTHGDCLEIVAGQFGFDSWNVLAARLAAAPRASAPPPADGGEASVALRPAVPVLRIFSVEKAKEFYLDFLGFALDWEHRFAADLPLYAQISRGDLLLHLSEHHGDASPGSKVFVPLHGIEALHRELSEKRYRYARPGLQDAPWGARVFEVTDPFGNRLFFNEPIEAPAG